MSRCKRIGAACDLKLKLIFRDRSYERPPKQSINRTNNDHLKVKLRGEKKLAISWNSHATRRLSLSTRPNCSNKQSITTFPPLRLLNVDRCLLLMENSRDQDSAAEKVSKLIRKREWPMQPDDDFSFSFFSLIVSIQTFHRVACVRIIAVWLINSDSDRDRWRCGLGANVAM